MDKSAKYRVQKIRDFRKENNLCANCGKPMDREGYYCNECREYSNLYKSERLHELHGNRLCKYCLTLLDNDRWLCESCADKHNKEQLNRIAKFKSEGKCIQCGKQLEEGYKKSRCRRCLDMIKERRRKKKLQEINNEH